MIGFVVEGEAGVGKTSLINKLAYDNRRRFKFLSVSCADLVHKVFIHSI